MILQRLLIFTIILIKVKANNYIEIISSFKSIPNDKTLANLVIQGKENTVSSSSLSTHVFAPVPNLEGLHIINILNSLDKNIFKSLQRLQHLKIEDNILNTIGAEVWAGLDLEKLSLRNNQINQLNNKVFDGLKVSMIDLSNNNLKALPDRCLRSLRVYKLTLANNQLESIDLETFGSELAYVDLSNNLLTSLNVEVFDGVYALLNLNLSGNKFTSIEAAPSLQKLRVLDYSNNEISVITGDAFVYYEELMELYLDHNQLFRLNYQSFPSIAPVKKLTIDHNYLTGLSDELLESWGNLAYLKFGGNPWSCKCLEEIEAFLKSKRIGTDPCEKKLMQRNKFCVEMYENCYGNETKLLANNFDIYEEFIQNYQC